jgi:hypothetical protein
VWPTIKEMIENARVGIIDDRETAIPPYDYELDELFDLEEPAELLSEAGLAEVLEADRQTNGTVTPSAAALGGEEH